MSKVQFTEEQIELLKANPYTYSVTANKLCLTKEFKELFYKEYLEGKLPREILESHGYPANVLGTNRINGICHVIMNEATRPEGFSEGTNNNSSRKPTGNIDTDNPQVAIKQLTHEVEYLRQEMEFLKKIISIKNTKN